MKMLISYLEVCIHVEKKATVEKYILCESSQSVLKMSNSPVTLFCFSHVELLSPHVKTLNSHLKLQLSQVKRQILRLRHFRKGQSYTDICEKPLWRQRGAWQRRYSHLY